MSGNKVIDEHPSKIELKLSTLDTFQFEISGKDNKQLHLAKKYSILRTLFVFHLEISGKEDKDLHS